MRIIGMIPVYNEADIIEYVIKHLLSQGIELVILDNASTDRSHEICSQYLGTGVLALNTLSSLHFEFDRLLQNLHDTASSFQPDWLILNAADEFLESPYQGLTLKEAVESDDQRGFNLIQFNNFEFFPTEKDEGQTEPDVRKRLKYYTWNDDLQFRCWKNYPGIKVTGTAGHYPILPEHVKYQVAKTKYVLRHYRFRSYEQGLRKVFADRLPRYLSAEKQQGRHIHYDKFRPRRSYFVIHSSNLIEYKNDSRWMTKKTFDWTWGVQGKPWAHPPKTHLSVLLANHFPFAVRVWKALTLKRKRLSESSE